MKTSPEQLGLQHIQTVCQGHADALSEALQDMQMRALGTEDYTHLNKEDRRLLDQFAHDYPDSPTERFERLQAAIQAAQQLLMIMAEFRQRAIGMASRS